MKHFHFFAYIWLLCLILLVSIYLLSVILGLHGGTTK